MNHEPDLNLNELSCVWGHPPPTLSPGQTDPVLPLPPHLLPMSVALGVAVEMFLYPIDQVTGNPLQYLFAS